MLELYQAEGCPYSRKVREKMTDLGLSYVAHNPRRPGDEGGDVLNEQVHAEMVDVSGEDQIPFLADHTAGQLHSGSDRIIEYLETEYSREQGER